MDVAIGDLEEMRSLLGKKVDIEIIKEEDYGKTAESIALGVDKLLKV